MRYLEWHIIVLKLAKHPRNIISCSLKYIHDLIVFTLEAFQFKNLIRVTVKVTSLYEYLQRSENYTMM